MDASLAGSQTGLGIARLAQGWADGGIANNGILIKASDEDRQHVDVLSGLHLGRSRPRASRDVPCGGTEGA